MDYNRKILIETANELKEAVDKAEQIIAEAKQRANERAGIIGYSGGFHIYDEDLFLEISKNEGNIIIRRPFSENYKYIYSIDVENLAFFHISNKELAFEV